MKPYVRPLLLTVVLLSLACRRSDDSSASDTQTSDTVPPSAAASFDWQQQIGLAFERDDKLCLRIRNPDLQPASNLLLIAPGDGSKVTSARVERLVTACPDELPNDELAYYTITPQDSLEMNARYFVVPQSATPAGNALDLDQDGVIEQFRACTSAEGVHFTVWSGKPLEGIRRWHYYYYLGYDVEPSCDERDTQPPDSTPPSSSTR